MKNDKSIFTMTLNPPAIEALKDSLLAYFEMEILQGEVTVLPNGQTEYKLSVPPEKEQIIKEFMIKGMNRRVVQSDN